MDDIEDYFGESQSLKDQGKSRTQRQQIAAVSAMSQSLKDQGKSRTWACCFVVYICASQSLKDQGKSRTLDSLAFARRQSFSLRKH